MDAGRVHEIVYTAELLLHTFDKSTDRPGVAHIDALGQDFDFELLEFLLDLRCFLCDRAARKIDPIKGDVSTAACELDRDVPADAGSSAADDNGATAQTAEVRRGLRLRLFAELLEKSFDGPTCTLG
jgi:hypothetical protein